MNPGQVVRLEDLAASPELRAVLVDHAYRGVRIQSALRLGLAVLVAATVLVQPPQFYRVTCEILAVVYLLWAVAAALLGQRGGEAPVRYMWLALFGDLAVLSALTLVAGLSTASWTADILVYGFFVLALLAATQLRPWLCAAVCLPTVIVYFLVGGIGRVVNGD